MRRLKLTVLLVGMLGLVSCDHVSKYWAKHELEGQAPVEVIPGVFDLRYVENHSTAFNTLGSVPDSIRCPLILVVNSLLIVLVLFFWYRYRRGTWHQHLAFALILSGALGNQVGRLFRGYVIDFMDIHYWPVFNAADIYICAGAIWLGFLIIKGRWAKPLPS